MKKIPTMGILLLFILWVFGCSESPPTDMKPRKLKTIEKSFIIKQLEAAEFFCASGSQCPENVGLVFSKKENTNTTISQCTGFLISNEKIITSADCVSEEQVKNSKNCSLNLAVRFLLQNGKSEYLKCKNVELISKQGLTEPNYAIIKIQKTKIAPVKLSNAGLKDGENIKVLKLTTLHLDQGAKLKDEVCSVGLNTLFHNKSVNRGSKIGVGIGCTFISGNAGAPVFNSHDEVIGVIQNNTSDDFSELVKQQAKELKVSSYKPSVSNVIFSNLACVPVKEKEDGVILLSCGNENTLKSTDCMSFQQQTTNYRLTEAVDYWRKSLPGIFIYKISFKDSNEFVAEPICVRSKTQYSEYDKYVTLEGIIGFRDEKIKLNYPKKLRIEKKVTVDENLKINPYYDFIETSRHIQNIKLTKEKNKWKGYSRSHLLNWDSSMKGEYSQPPVILNDCTQQQNQEGVVYVQTFKSKPAQLTKKPFYNGYLPTPKLSCDQ